MILQKYVSLNYVIHILDNHKLNLSERKYFIDSFLLYRITWYTPYAIQQKWYMNAGIEES